MLALRVVVHTGLGARALSCYDARASPPILTTDVRSPSSNADSVAAPSARKQGEALHSRTARDGCSLGITVGLPAHPRRINALREHFCRNGFRRMVLRIGPGDRLDNRRRDCRERALRLSVSAVRTIL